MSSPSRATTKGTADTCEVFAETYGEPAALTACAPGRVNLIGEHVDYQDGLVMPAAVDRYVFAAAAPSETPEVMLWSAHTGAPAITIPLDRTEPLVGDERWANYAFGVFAKYRDAGHPVSGINVSFTADLPVGAGLSSSAALESAMAMLVEATSGISLPPRERALLCQAAEHDYAGVPCGIMDQLAVNCGVDGHALFIDCRTLDIAPAPLPDDLCMVVVDSRVHHSLADGEYAKRRADCSAAADGLGVASLRDASLEQVEAAVDALGPRVAMRARHVVSEITRATDFTAALQAGDALAAGRLMAASHNSLRDNYEVSCAELDALVEIANEAGAIGSRMMGGGFGGSTINLVRKADAASIADQIEARYEELHGAGVTAFIVEPVGGASAYEAS